jgi:hypothetical protein
MLVFLVACGSSADLPPDAQVTPPDGALKNPVAWSARGGAITLAADDFYLIANGTKYLGDTATLSIDSDAGTPQYTTLELTWMENAVEMRFSIYVAADSTNWYASELRTYNGAAEGDWIYYDAGGGYFTTPLGASFHGDLDALSTTPTGSIHLENATFKAL